jgi:hypothetical protein
MKRSRSNTNSTTKEQHMNAKTIRQGDVSLVRVTKLPADAVEIKTESERVVLAYGEVTGHAHAIYEDIDKVRVWAVGKVKYLEVMATVMLRHEEHTHAAIEPGIYKLPVQVEYEPQELRITRD